MIRRAASRPQADADALDARVLLHWKELARLEAAWREMHKRCRGRLFSSFDWLAAQYEAYGLPGELRIVTIWRGSSMEAAAALCLVRRQICPLVPFYRPRVLYGWGCRRSGFFEFLAVSRSALRALLRAVSEAAPRGGIELERFRICTRDAFITRSLRLQGFRLRNDRFQDCGIVESPEDWERFYQTRSHAFRAEAEAQRQQMAESGTELSMVTSGGAEVMQRALAVLRKSREEHHPAAEDLAQAPGREKLLAELWRRFAAAGNACCLLLHSQKGDFAFALGLRSGAVWHLIGTEVAATAAVSPPGSQLTCLALQTMIARRPSERIELNCGWRFSRGLETSAYQVRRMRAVPRGSLSDLVLRAAGIWQQALAQAGQNGAGCIWRVRVPWQQAGFR